MIEEKSTDGYETIQVDITDEEFLTIAKLAHERDITINKMIEHILWEEIKRHKDEQIQGQGSTDQS